MCTKIEMASVTRKEQGKAKGRSRHKRVCECTGAEQGGGQCLGIKDRKRKKKEKNSFLAFWWFSSLSQGLTTASSYLGMAERRLYLHNHFLSLTCMLPWAVSVAQAQRTSAETPGYMVFFTHPCSIWSLESESPDKSEDPKSLIRECQGRQSGDWKLM